MNESELQVAVADYIIRAYPEVVFHSDFGSGAKLRPYQAKIQKMQNGGRRAWPDLFIAEPTCRENCGCDIWNHGLFIELKKDGTRLKKKNGEWASDHIAEQAEVLGELRKRGYIATFAVGLDSAINIIDDYLIDKN